MSLNSGKVRLLLLLFIIICTTELVSASWYKSIKCYACSYDPKNVFRDDEHGTKDCLLGRRTAMDAFLVDTVPRNATFVCVTETIIQLESITETVYGFHLPYTITTATGKARARRRSYMEKAEFDQINQASTHTSSYEYNAESTMDPYRLHDDTTCFQQEYAYNLIKKTCFCTASRCNGNPIVVQEPSPLVKPSRTQKKAKRNNYATSKDVTPNKVLSSEIQADGDGEELNSNQTESVESQIRASS